MQPRRAQHLAAETQSKLHELVLKAAQCVDKPEPSASAALLLARAREALERLLRPLPAEEVLDCCASAPWQLPVVRRMPWFPALAARMLARAILLARAVKVRAVKEHAACSLR